MEIPSCDSEIVPLSAKQWREFFITDIFDNIQRGKRLKTADHIQGNIPYISSSAQNNGVDNFSGNKDNVRRFENCLTISNSGSVGKAFYHPYKFIASDHVTMLSASLNKWQYIFMSSITDRLQENYSFNREINDSRIRNEKILLPINDEGEPDFEYMELYTKQKFAQILKMYVDR